MMKNRNFKGLSYYNLHLDSDGNIRLNNYSDVLNARRARVDLLLDKTKQGDVNLSKLNKALNDHLIDDKGLSLAFEKEDKEVVREKLKMSSILDNLDKIANIKSQDLLDFSLFLSDLSFIERNIVLNDNQNFDLVVLRNLFIEKKVSGKEYSHEECKNYLSNIEKINTLIKLELESRIEGITDDEKSKHDSLQDEIARLISIK